MSDYLFIFPVFFCWFVILLLCIYCHRLVLQLPGLDQDIVIKMSSFERVFAGKLSLLTRKLEASRSLLLLLIDKGVLLQRHVDEINKMPNQDDDSRAERLLNLLHRRDEYVVADVL